MFVESLVSAGRINGRETLFGREIERAVEHLMWCGRTALDVVDEGKKKGDLFIFLFPSQNMVQWIALRSVASSRLNQSSTRVASFVRSGLDG